MVVKRILEKLLSDFNIIRLAGSNKHNTVGRF